MHVVYGTAFTTLFFRNYYIGVPEELIKAARIDGAGFFLIFRKIVLPISGPIFVVCIIWQFTQIWNDFLFGIVFASGDSQPITVALEQPGQHVHGREGIQRRHGRGDDRRAADPAGLSGRRHVISCAV